MENKVDKDKTKDIGVRWLGYEARRLLAKKERENEK